jgi:hypothetical protein
MGITDETTDMIVAVPVTVLEALDVWEVPAEDRPSILGQLVGMGAAKYVSDQLKELANETSAKSAGSLEELFTKGE